MDVDSLFSKIKEHCITKSKNEKFITKLYNYIIDEEYDIQDLNDKEIQSMIKDHIKNQTNSMQTMNVFNQMIQILNSTQNKSPSIQIINSQPKQSKYSFIQEFTKLFPNSRNQLLTKDNIDIQLTKYIKNKTFCVLLRLEKASIKNNIPIAEHLITGYHQSGLNRDQYMAQNKLFQQLTNNYNITFTNKNSNIAYEMMREYLIEYDKHIAKPLPHSMDQQINISKYNDDIAIVMNYIMEINNGIFTKNVKYPLQLDVFFIAPNSHNDLKLHSLNGLDYINGIISTANSRQKVDAIALLRNLLRRERNIHKSHGQRIIMLIVRENEDNSCLDTIYIYKPNNNNSIPPKHISDNVELTYLLNSKSLIINGLSSTDIGVLGITYHLHSNDCTKMFISYGNHKSRVFKETFLYKLQLLFNWNNNKKHYISDSQRIQFMDSYPNLQDVKYTQFGKHWFGNPVISIKKQQQDLCLQINTTIKNYKGNNNNTNTPVMSQMIATKSMPNTPCFVQSKTPPSYTYKPNIQQPFIQNQSMYLTYNTPLFSSVPLSSMQRQQSVPCNSNINNIVNIQQFKQYGQHYAQIYDQMILINNNLNAKQQIHTTQINQNVNSDEIISPCDIGQKNVYNNKKKKRRKKSKSHKRTFTNAFRKKHNNCATYDACCIKCARSNIQIPRTFTAKILTLIVEDISDIFSYILKYTDIHSNNEYMNGKIRIFNYNFHAKNGGHILYCVAEKQDNKHRGYLWKMCDKLFTKCDIKQMYNISMSQLPLMDKSNVCIDQKHINQINEMKKNIFNNKDIKWNRLAIYSRDPKRRTGRSKCSITMEKFKIQIYDKYCMPLIPIIMFKGNDICIQYLWICSIRLDCYYGIDYLSLLMDKKAVTCNYPKNIIYNILLHIVPSTDIAIAFEYDVQNKYIIPVGIHLDRFCIINNHQILSLKHSMNDLNDFESIYDDLQIGNVDEDENYIKDLRKQNMIIQNDKKTLQNENKRLMEIIKKLKENK